MYGGVLSGLMDFRRRALLSATYSVAKLVCIVLLVAAGFSLTGAIAGNIAASVVGVVVGWRITRGISGREPAEVSRVVRFAAPVSLNIFVATILGAIGLYFIKAMAPSDETAGFYASAANLVHGPGLVFTGIAAVLFPSLSSAAFAGDKASGIVYIRQSLRLLFLLLMPTVFVIIATAEDLISFLFSEVYLPASPPLRVLVVGLAFASLLRLLNTVMIAEGRPRVPLLIGLVQLPVAALLCIGLIPSYGMVGAAVSWVLTGALGCGLSFYMVASKYGIAIVPTRTLLRTVAASLALYALASYSLGSGIHPIPLYILLGPAYLVLLFVMGEVTRNDRAQLAALIAPLKSLRRSST